MSVSPYDDPAGFSICAVRIDRHPRGLATLPRDQQRHQLTQDMQQWLDEGHRITPLPCPVLDPASRYVRFTSLLDQLIGYHYG